MPFINFILATLNHVEFPGQQSHLSCCYNLSHRCPNAGFFNLLGQARNPAWVLGLPVFRNHRRSSSLCILFKVNMSFSVPLECGRGFPEGQDKKMRFMACNTFQNLCKNDFRLRHAPPRGTITLTQPSIPNTATAPVLDLATGQYVYLNFAVLL